VIAYKKLALKNDMKNTNRKTHTLIAKKNGKKNII